MPTLYRLEPITGTHIRIHMGFWRDVPKSAGESHFLHPSGPSDKHPSQVSRARLSQLLYGLDKQLLDNPRMKGHDQFRQVFCFSQVSLSRQSTATMKILQRWLQHAFQQGSGECLTFLERQATPPSRKIWTGERTEW